MIYSTINGEYTNRYIIYIKYVIITLIIKLVNIYQKDSLEMKEASASIWSISKLLTSRYELWPNKERYSSAFAISEIKVYKYMVIYTRL